MSPPIPIVLSALRLCYTSPCLVAFVGSTNPKNPYDQSCIASDSVPVGDKLAKSATLNSPVALLNTICEGEALTIRSSVNRPPKSRLGILELLNKNTITTPHRPFSAHWVRVYGCRIVGTKAELPCEACCHQGLLEGPIPGFNQM
ncbi:hypothetical protein BDQ17DRAFT_1108315 [Cyathus striatus]|nr:hypothetical protein BDQ17DRAFT_1108315 [Cyathus striatus]